MKQIISKGKRVVCTTTEPYSKEIVKAMKEAGYKVKTLDDEEDND